MSNTKEIVFQAIGHGSMCWTPIPSGVFDSTEALKAGQPIVDAMDEQQATIAKLRRFVLDQLCSCHDEYGRRFAKPCERCQLWYECETWEQFDKVAKRSEGD